MKQFNDMKKMMKQFTGGGKGKKLNETKCKIYVKGYELTILIYKIKHRNSRVSSVLDF